MKLREDKLDEMSYIDYLKWMQDAANHITYSKGSTDAYTEAKELVNNFIKRFMKENGLTSENYHVNNEIGSNLHSTKVGLEDYYKYDKTDKMKAQTISEFKSDMDSDITRIIYDLENK